MSKEVEEAIKKLNSIVKVHKDFLKGCNEEKISEKEIKAIETVLKYIEELLRSRMNWMQRYKLLSRKIDCIPKQAIRDKIEEDEEIEIDIDSIEEFELEFLIRDEDSYKIRSKINKLIKAVKQLNKKTKE